MIGSSSTGRGAAAEPDPRPAAAALPRLVAHAARDTGRSGARATLRDRAARQRGRVETWSCPARPFTAIETLADPESVLGARAGAGAG